MINDYNRYWFNVTPDNAHVKGRCFTKTQDSLLWKTVQRINVGLSVERRSQFEEKGGRGVKNEIILSWREEKWKKSQEMYGGSFVFSAELINLFLDILCCNALHPGGHLTYTLPEFISSWNNFVNEIILSKLYYEETKLALKPRSATMFTYIFILFWLKMIS